MFLFVNLMFDVCCLRVCFFASLLLCLFASLFVAAVVAVIGCGGGGAWLLFVGF